jgi:hypothetical protein
LYSGELCDVLSSANTVIVIARRVRWVKRLARNKQTSNAYTYLLENLNERGNLQNLSVDVRIILKLIVKLMYGCMMNSSDSGHGPVVGCCEHGNEHSFSIND